MRKLAGFTIIELVVVVAIIGILASIIMINITGYFNRSKDVRMKSNMHTLQVNGIARGITSSGVSYSKEIICGTYTQAWLAAKEVDPNGARCNVSIDRKAWCAYVKELSKSNTYYCVDSTGKAVETHTDCRNSANTSYCGSTDANNLICLSN